MSWKETPVHQSTATLQNGSLGKFFDHVENDYTPITEVDSEDETLSLEGNVITKRQNSRYANDDAAYIYRHVIVFVFLVSIVTSGILVLTNAMYTTNLEKDVCRVQEYTLEKITNLGKTEIELKRDNVKLCSVHEWNVAIHLRKGCSAGALNSSEEKCVAELKLDGFGIFRNYENLVTGKMSHILTGANNTIKTSKVYIRLEDRGIALSRGKQPPQIDPQIFLTIEY